MAMGEEIEKNNNNKWQEEKCRERKLPNVFDDLDSSRRVRRCLRAEDHYTHRIGACWKPFASYYSHVLL